MPERLSGAQLELVRGAIRWPEVFLGEDFSDYRLQLECLLARRKTAHSISGRDVSGEVQDVAAQMRQTLRSKIRGMTPTEYTGASKFLESLAYEARFPAVNAGLAAN